MPEQPSLSNLARLLRTSAVLLVAVGLLAGCAGYYLQAVAGQAALMGARLPVAEVLEDPATPATLKQQLLTVEEVLLFARVELALPPTRSYRQYADLGRPYVVWNVFAAPEFSLEPRQWCYPIAGCATYRGWFSEERAQGYADRLEAAGEDVFVGGVAAYSTLGWFADPVINTMLGGNAEELAGLLFHELAHQKLYVPGDTLFNEGFATLVEEEGTRRWLAARNDSGGLCALEVRRLRRAAVLGIVAELRTRLAVVYGGEGPSDLRRQQRAAVFDEARASYGRLRADWPEPPWFDSWFEPGLNNARLAALSAYEDYLPAFRALLAREGGDLPRFYASVQVLGDLEPAARDQAMQDLLLESPAPVSAQPSSGSCP